MIYKKHTLTWKKKASVQFTMRKEDLVTVILHYEEALEMKHKFVLRLINDKWLIDDKYYGFSDEETCYNDML